ncbi:MAG: hypothetical protein H0U61_10690 [Nocardioidaceae bacterium]|nr:hypothetical protein [Nocardioidaceae bacterium]
MTHEPMPGNRLFDSLNPLVQRQVLSPRQADEVFRAVSAESSVGARTEPAEAPGWERSRGWAGLVVFGAVLLVAALAVASTHAREPLRQTLNGDAGSSGFNGKAFTIMVAITVVLAAAAAANHLLLARRPYAGLVTSALAALALLSLASTLTSTWDQSALVYLSAVVLLAAGIAGFWYLNGLAFVPVAVLGGLLLVGQLLSDLLDGDELGTGTVMTVGMLVLAYGLVVVAAGWAFPCRTLTTMLGGGIALAAMWFTILTLGFVGIFTRISTDVSLDPANSGPQLSPDDIRTDIRIAMFLGVVVGLGLVAAFVYTSYRGLLVLSLIGVTAVVASGVGFTAIDHPMRWAIGFAVVGTLVAVGSLGAQVGRSSRGGSGPAYPVGPQGSHPSYGQTPTTVQQRPDQGTGPFQRRRLELSKGPLGLHLKG